MENILRQVQERMMVDPVTLIEAHKESFFDPPDPTRPIS
jgi:hypothetical protein